MLVRRDPKTDVQNNNIISKQPLLQALINVSDHWYFNLIFTNIDNKQCEIVA